MTGQWPLAIPLKSWQRAYNSSIKTVLKEHPNLAKRFNSYLPQLPFMYGLPKIHKPNNSLRPIISFVNSVTYSLSKYVASFLKPLLGTISGSHLINSDNFIDKIRHVNLGSQMSNRWNNFFSWWISRPQPSFYAFQ